MDRLWAWAHPVSVREVLENLQTERTIAYTTVMTVLDNLHSKGFLRRELEGRAYRYEPAQTREEHIATVMTEALDSSTDRAAALLHFVEQMSVEEATRLREALGQSAATRQRPGQ